jgi:hypothetical protein
MKMEAIEHRPEVLVRQLAKLVATLEHVATSAARVKGDTYLVVGGLSPWPRALGGRSIGAAPD